MNETLACPDCENGPKECKCDGVSETIHFTYKEKDYTVQAEIEMKDISTGKWVDAIAYLSYETGKVYIREKTDFIKKFKPKR